VGEGAVSVLLARAQSTPAPPFARVLGASLGSPGSLAATIRDALARAGCTPERIDLVFGSADGTVESGAREMRGCEEALGRRPPISNPTTLVGRTGIADGFALAAAAIALRTGHGFTVDGDRIPVRTVLVICDEPESGCVAVVSKAHSAEDSPHG
jgi:minimal PKS chain-length factor (CLF/KS beta)